MTSCEAPRCEAEAVELVVVRELADRYPGIELDDDGALRLVLCDACAGQILDALARVDRISLRSYAIA